jgi:hypothetical protein
MAYIRSGGGGKSLVAKLKGHTVRVTADGAAVISGSYQNAINAWIDDVKVIDNIYTRSAVTNDLLMKEESGNATEGAYKMYAEYQYVDGSGTSARYRLNVILNYQTIASGPATSFYGGSDTGTVTIP